MTEHTKTPFEVETIADDYVIGTDILDDVIAYIPSGSKNAKANAAFIVKACNAHDKAFRLLQLCREMNTLSLETQNGIDELFRECEK